MVWEHNTNIAEYCRVRKLSLQTYAHSQLLDKFPNIPVVTHKQQAASTNVTTVMGVHSGKNQYGLGA
jgi:hypothetical protein